MPKDSSATSPSNASATPAYNAERTIEETIDSVLAQTDEDFELSNETFSEVSLPNEENFYPDDRLEEANFATNVEPCMENCGDGPAEIVMRARILDVTPDGDDESGAGGID